MWSTYFKTTNYYNPKAQVFLAWFFTVFTIGALYLDSKIFALQYFDGQLLTTIGAIMYFGLLFLFSDAELKKLMVVMVLLSYIGELIFSEWLQMYHYRLNCIPIYVPFGHAIVYASGYIFGHTQWAFKNEKLLGRFFLAFFVALFLLVGIFFEDRFTLIFGVFFFLLLKRKKWQNLYYFIALCVIFIELFGTYFQCWKWVPKCFGIIPTANPPIGAVFFYAGGDVLLAKIVSLLNRKYTTS